MIGRKIGQRLLTAMVVVGLLAMTFGIGAATAQESESVSESVETGEATENVSVQNESSQTIEESVTETETSFATDGTGDLSDEDGDAVDGGDDFIDTDFGTDIVDQTLANVGEMFD
ncbi:hypothetical protein [Halopiger xanaduensis]|uniref:Uncharacterized protein n=1 Tax=Halopiger xanaduensis (strain DSM 18323 / JCM 14033 / SH-6) TaxID=797210 RepID=F8D9T0_HALXS|nr:hypothetical protein [Halopiger xanaduensis]AEH35707.1 hypothetical protein Halxa_1073 [Halopiger xanaduensis SH-6]